MMTRTRKWIVIGAVLLGLVAFIGFCFIPTATSRPLEIQVLERTNDASGCPMMRVSVTNRTGDLRQFYIIASVPASNGQWFSTGVVLRPPSMPDRLEALSSCEAWLPAPARTPEWKFICTSRRKMNEAERLWYACVARLGLARVGLRDGPVESRVATDKLTR
jgi:hypothetical protein